MGTAARMTRVRTSNEPTHSLWWLSWSRSYQMIVPHTQISSVPHTRWNSSERECGTRYHTLNWKWVCHSSSVWETQRAGKDAAPFSMLPFWRSRPVFRIRKFSGHEFPSQTIRVVSVRQSSLSLSINSTIVGQDFSVPIKPITRLVLKANSISQIGALILRIYQHLASGSNNPSKNGLIALWSATNGRVSTF